MLDGASPFTRMGVAAFKRRVTRIALCSASGTFYALPDRLSAGVDRGGIRSPITRSRRPRIQRLHLSIRATAAQRPVHRTGDRCGATLMNAAYDADQLVVSGQGLSCQRIMQLNANSNSVE
jgi:hypothetical protein